MKIFAIAIALLGFIGFVHADGGAVIAQQTIDSRLVTVFAEPSPLRAGPADFSVMVQDAKSGEPILDETVTVSLTAASESSEAWVPPCCSMENRSNAVPATREKAQNKLLYQANVIVPAAGPIDVVVRIGQPESVLTTRVEARPPLPPVAAYWPYFLLPPAAIGLFALNQRIRRR